MMNKGDAIPMIDWNKASELGLIERINNDVLHPLGLSMGRNPDSGQSPGLMVSDDGEWEYPDEMPMKPRLSAREIQEVLRHGGDDNAY